MISSSEYSVLAARGKDHRKILLKRWLFEIAEDTAKQRKQPTPRVSEDRLQLLVERFKK